MTITDYVIDILLIAVVGLQLRTRKLTARSALRPLLLVAVACANYLRGFPLAGHDLVLIAGLTVVGIGLGAASGVATRTWRDAEGSVFVRAGVAAAALWVAGMGFRFAFAVYAHTTGGAVAIGHLSRHLDITSAQAWTTALVLMAVGEVLARIAFLELRRHRLLHGSAARVFGAGRLIAGAR